MLAPFNQLDAPGLHVLAVPSPCQSKFAGGVVTDAAALVAATTNAPLKLVALAGGITGLMHTVTAVLKA